MMFSSGTHWSTESNKAMWIKCLAQRQQIGTAEDLKHQPLYIACLCYHCHSCTAPSYVAEMLQKNPPHTRNTRSNSYTIPLLNKPEHSKATLGDRSFSFSSVWNSIPNDVRCAPSLSSFKFDDIPASFSLQRLNFLFDHCTYVHGLALLLLC